MLDKEELGEHLVSLAKLLKDTNTIIGCLQAMAEARKLEKQGDEVPKQLETANKIINSINLRMSLEKNHEELRLFLEEQLKAMGESTEQAEELETEETVLPGF